MQHLTSATSKSLLVRWTRGAVILIHLAVGLTAMPATAGFFDDVGYTQLAQELGDALPTGAAVGIAQVESGSSGAYAPMMGDTAFAGKTFQLMSGDSAVSKHANVVAKKIYGNTQSMAPGVAGIDLWSAPLWLQSGFLRTFSVDPPRVERRQVQNHSWVGSMSSRSAMIDAQRRLDYAIARDGFTAVVAMSNGDSAGLPDLLGQSYNTISVGRSDGKHSHGHTLLDGAGRAKPDLVAPAPTTSSATARVSSAAALLLEAAAGSDAARPEAVKAILLAGTTKDAFVEAWTRTPEHPLDEVYGAGQLNIDRSYHIVAAGRQRANDKETVGLVGWDYRPIAGDAVRYYFDIPRGGALVEWSAALTWNRTIIDDERIGFSPVSSLADLDLALYRIPGAGPDQLLDASRSSVDNVEYLYRSDRLGIGMELGPGRYAVEVRNASSDPVDFALAWSGQLGPLMGDMDLSGWFDYDDILPFAQAVSDPAGYQATYGIAAVARGDLDGNGLFDFDDIRAFREHLERLAVTASVASVPEPPVHVLWAGLLTISLWRRRTAARFGRRASHGGRPG